ncbi:MAG: hypothetical protein Q8M98_07800 [Candidatus Cloacimonadaceae bacterium]|nr:hypothetical protein [Candidatus Cloacimonadaceae bacterium]
MKRSRLFLFLIVILLFINAAFFITWYAFDLQGVVKGIVEKEAGKALSGEFSIRNFSISDRQVYAEKISFTTADSSLAFNVESARVRFNLFKFLFSGFKIKHLLNIVEIHKPEVTIIIEPQVEKKVKKAPDRIDIPDLTPYFNHLKVTKGRLYLDIAIPLKLGEGEFLIAADEFNEIEISADNDKSTKVKLSAITANKGSIVATANLDKGRIALLDVEINNFSPRYVNHPAIENIHTELNLVLKASQKTKKADLDIQAKAFIWNTSALLLSEYPVRLPFIVVETDGNNLDATISRSSFGSSSLGGQISLSNLQKRIGFKSSQLDIQLDLAMIDPSLSGIVKAQLSGSGSLKEPVLKLQASADFAAYDTHRVHGIRLDAELKDMLVDYNLGNARWQNQSIASAGSFDLKTYVLTASFDTHPIETHYDEPMINASADFELSIYDSYPEIKVQFKQLDIVNRTMAATNFSGSVHLIPASNPDKTQNYYINCDLSSPDGHHISLVGDVLDRNLLMEARFGNIALADFIPNDVVKTISPKFSGTVDGFMLGDKIVARTDLSLTLAGDFEYQTQIHAIGSLDISTLDAALYLQGTEGILNGETMNIELVADLKKDILRLAYLRLNDMLDLSGMIDLKNLPDYAINLSLKDFNLARLTKYYPPAGEGLPDISGINVTAMYNLDGDRNMSVFASADSIRITGIVPISADLMLKGPPGEIQISGHALNNRKKLVSINGIASLNGGIGIDLNAEINEVLISDVIAETHLNGVVTAKLNVLATGLMGKDPNMEFTARVRSPRISIPNAIDLEDIIVDVRQTPEILYVDSLLVRSGELVALQGSGSLGYNFLSGTFFDGSLELKIKAQAELFPWLTKNVEMITDSGGTTSLDVTIATHEDQFHIASGRIELRNGHLKLDNQVDSITNINIIGVFDKNRLLLKKASLELGGGKLKISNEFDEDSSNHFFVSFLDLGSFNLLIEEPGIEAVVPVFTPPRTLTTIQLRGQNTRFATVKGPFDDMKISAEVLVSNTNALYPPNTENLLSLIYSFRSAFAKETESSLKEDPLPLPFTLDLMIRLQDNVIYATYPAIIKLTQGGFIHIVYDGQEWIAKDAKFASEQGTIDFFGTVFQAEYLDVNIIGSRDILNIHGSFFRRAPDGTIITLTLLTDNDSSKPFFDRLEFKLASDNPQDQSITHILSRLRSSNEVYDQGMFQDEALGLISDNLNTSILTPFLYPVQNRIRRLLRLDGFSIKAGFIQNLFTEYSNNPDQMADYLDMQHFIGDIAQFSSSILLNNLSVSMSKYLGRKLFLDYQITLQEATDLQKKTKIGITHDTSLRMFLPRQLRLGYTFQYEPQDERLTHEVMLQRSFRFWGL